MYWNCIYYTTFNTEFRLIETWDVLKLEWDYDFLALPRINRNMRCIETFRIQFQFRIQFWLIETWDVLKPFLESAKYANESWLIETWDVLKQGMHVNVYVGYYD